MYLKILQNSQENPRARASFLIKLQLKKRLRHYCEIFKKTFFYRTPPVLASVKIRTKSLKLPKFQFQLFLTTLDIMGSNINNIYIQYHAIYIYIYFPYHAIPTEKYFWWCPFILQVKLQKKQLNWNKNSLQWYVFSRRSFPAFTEWMVLWNHFLDYLSVKNTSLFNFFKRKIVWQFDVRSNVTQDLGNTRLF